MFDISTTLVIGYDKSNNKDKTAMAVSSYDGRTYHLLNIFYDSEAEALYQKLTEKRVVELK